MKKQKELKQESTEMSKGGKVPKKNKWGTPIGEKTSREMVRISQTAFSLRELLPSGDKVAKLPPHRQKTVKWLDETYAKLERPWDIPLLEFRPMMEKIETLLIYGNWSDFYPPWPPGEVQQPTLDFEQCVKDCETARWKAEEERRRKEAEEEKLYILDRRILEVSCAMECIRTVTQP